MRSPAAPMSPLTTLPLHERSRATGRRSRSHRTTEATAHHPRRRPERRRRRDPARRTRCSEQVLSRFRRPSTSPQPPQHTSSSRAERRSRSLQFVERVLPSVRRVPVLARTTHLGVTRVRLTAPAFARRRSGKVSADSRAGRIGGPDLQGTRGKRIMAEVLTRLYGVATDEETAVLDSLTLRAGLAWHCECGWHNSERVAACEDCGSRAPRLGTTDRRPPRRSIMAKPLKRIDIVKTRRPLGR